MIKESGKEDKGEWEDEETRRLGGMKCIIQILNFDS